MIWALVSRSPANASKYNIATSFGCEGHHRAGAYDFLQNITHTHTYTHTHTHCSIPYSSTCKPASTAISYVTSRTTRSMPNCTSVNQSHINTRSVSTYNAPIVCYEPHLSMPNFATHQLISSAPTTTMQNTMQPPTTRATSMRSPSNWARGCCRTHALI